MPNIKVAYGTSEIRRMARVSLRGNWFKVILGFSIIVFLESIPLLILQRILDVDFYYEMMNMTYQYSNMTQNDIGAVLTPMAIYSIYSLLISGPLALGLCMFVLKYLRTKNEKYDLLLSGFAFLGKAIGLHIIISLLIFLGALMFIIPAIIFGLAFSMGFYVLADNPDMKVTNIAGFSWRIMNGNKFKLFCLYLSFLGWLLLTIVAVSTLALLIGSLESLIPTTDGYVFAIFSFIASTLILVPVQVYMTTSEAIFYEMVSGRIPSGPVFISIDGQGRYWQGPYSDGFHGQWGPPPYDQRQQGQSSQSGQDQDQGQLQGPPPYGQLPQDQAGQYQDQGQRGGPPPYGAAPPHSPDQRNRDGRQDQGQREGPPRYSQQPQDQTGQDQDQGQRQSQPPEDSFKE